MALLFLVFHLCGLMHTCAFKICAFNVQNFGESKSSNSMVINSVVKILSRCDVCLLQEVRDYKGKVIPVLLSALNRYEGSQDYDYVASERLGRNPVYQEQYVFVYRKSSVRVLEQYQYPDTQKGDVDAFAREPFVLRLRAPNTVQREFVLVPQHTSPSNATKEIDELYDVFMDVKKKWRLEDVMFLGDFNAACGYVAKKNRAKIRLMSEPGFYWLIDDNVDTTVRDSTNCAYDRIVVHGESFLKAIVPLSARAFRFDKELKLSSEQALQVSDHYPVEVTLKTLSASGQTEARTHVIVSTAALVLLSALV